MKLTNKTNWRTDQLRAIVKEVAKREMVSLDHAQVTFKNRARKSSVNGWAYYGMPVRTLIRLPVSTVDKVELAYVLAHEMAHSQGIHHCQMRKDGPYRRGGDWRATYAWAEALPLERKPEQLKLPAIPRQLSIQVRMIHAQAMANHWQRKVKFGQTWLRKWTRRARRYELQMMKAAEKGGAR